MAVRVLVAGAEQDDNTSGPNHLPIVLTALNQELATPACHRDFELRA